MRFMVFEKLRYLTADVPQYLSHHHALGRTFGIEITLNDPSFLRSLDEATYERLARDLKNYELSVHLPFYGLNLGCYDRWIADYSERTLREGLELCARLNIKTAVTHTTIPALLGSHSWKPWLNRFLERKARLELHARAHGVSLRWENTYESDFALFDAMIAQDPDTKFCLDVGHVRCFAKRPITDFIDHLGTRIAHIHLHDNDGTDDHHWPIGKGDVDYVAIMEGFSKMAVDTAVFELEPADFKESLPQIERNILSRLS
jgi:sugar phosphate isomerase/epimerase